MQNKNEYKDELFAQGSNELQTAIDTLWEAGASMDNIEGEIANALENAMGDAYSVRIYPK